MQLVLPLFATSFSGAPREFKDGGQTPTGLQDIILVVKRNDGSADDHEPYEFQLLLDAKTHLPFAMTWFVSRIAQHAVETNALGEQTAVNSQARELPKSGDRVEWRMLIADYKVADGLNWPHRFTTVVDGKTLEDERISTFTINPKIDPKTFKPTKW